MASGDGVQGGAEGVFAVALVMVRDGKAVGFLLDASDQGKDGRISHDADFPSLRGHQGAGTVPVVLDHTEDGDPRAERYDH